MKELYEQGDNFSFSMGCFNGQMVYRTIMLRSSSIKYHIFKLLVQFSCMPFLLFAVADVNVCLMLVNLFFARTIRYNKDTR
jgi:hypothetical protein